MALEQYRQGSTYYGYDPTNQQGIAFSDPTQFNKYFPSFNNAAPAPTFDVSKLMQTPNQLMPLNPQSNVSPTNPATPSTPGSPVPPPMLNTPNLPNISSLESQYQNLLSPTAQENQFSTQLADVQGQESQNKLNTQLGQNALEGQGRGIPLPLIRGQQGKLGVQGQLINQGYEVQQQTLQQKLALLQAQRQSSLEASKFALSRADQQVAAAKEDSRYKAEQTLQQQKELAAQRKDLGITSRFFKYEGNPTVYDSTQIDPTTGSFKGLDANAYQAAGGVGGNYSDVQTVQQKLDVSKYPASYQEYLLAKQEGFKGTYNDYQTMDANRKRSITNNTTTNILNDQTKEFDLRVKQAPAQVSQLAGQGYNWGQIASYFQQLGVDPGVKEIDDALHRQFQSPDDYQKWKGQ